jgi:hypothetical protein
MANAPNVNEAVNAMLLNEFLKCYKFTIVQQLGAAPILNILKSAAVIARARSTNILRPGTLPNDLSNF